MRYKSFDQFVSEMDRSEEIEKEVQDLSEPEQKDVEDTEAEADKVQTNEAEEVKGEAPTEVKEEQAETVSKQLEKCYEYVVTEAKVYETDAHDEHTIEGYMCENAALVASLAAKACKNCKEEYGEEAYEAALNMIKEAFCNKIEEIKIELNGETPADAEEKSAD